MKKLCQPLDGKCTQCGYAIAPGVRRQCKPGVEPRAFKRLQRQPEGLGDWVERQLKKIGVTEDRWGEAKAMVGLDPSCGCATRRAWLNKVSDWWRGEH